MNKNSDQNNLRLLIAAAAIGCAMLFFVRNALFRDLWFDEALTIREFMFLSGPWKIYSNYVIPNNQIVYTILLKCWNALYYPLIANDVYWRLFSLLCGILTVATIFCGWRKRFGVLAVAPILLALVGSLPFEIYSTALRGYMLSMLWVTAAWCCARSWHLKPRTLSAISYTILCLLAVGTIPTNILALAGIVLWFLPCYGVRGILRRRFVLLWAVPVASLVLFYLPIADNVFRIMALREGWHDAFAASLVVYSGFGIALLPILIFSILGGLFYLFRGKDLRFAWPLLSLLIPLPFIWGRIPAPFPRVFIVLWPIWLLLMASGLRNFMGLLVVSGRWPRHRLVVVAAILSVLAFGWGLWQREFRATLSARLVDSHGLDDYFYPYYMRTEYRPYQTLQRLLKIYDGKPLPPIFLTFGADPYPLLLYGAMTGIPNPIWRFDNPRGQVQTLSFDALLIMHVDEARHGKISELRQRFALPPQQLLFENGIHAIYRAWPEARTQCVRKN